VDASCGLISNGVGVADGVWFVDASTVDIDGNGAMLRHVDLTTNQVDRSVTLPFLNGYLATSATTVFYGESGEDYGWFRLVPGATAFEQLPIADDVAQIYPAGLGVWIQPAPNGDVQNEADFITTSATPDLAVHFDDGALVGADDGAFYVNQFGSPSDTLMRYPGDGSAPVAVLSGASVETSNGSFDFTYLDNDPLVIGEGHVAKLWLLRDWPTVDVTSIVSQATQLP
jgi:hypothetical protein